MFGSWQFDSTTMRIAVVVFFCLLVACVLLVVGLLLLRVFHDWRDRHREEKAAELRTVFFELVMGEPREALRAERFLHRMSPREWRFARAQAFSMLPKLRGESRDHLIRLLRDKGSIAVALEQVRSVSMVRRCRGAFALGALQDQDHADVLIDLLGDPAFLVRRVSVRALGNLGAAEAVRPLVDLAGVEPRLSRDLVYALHRIGAAGTGDMREHLRTVVDSGDPDRSGDLVATVLGTLGDYPSRHVLVDGLRSDRPELAAACAEALGE
ncbi:MAG: HEAT repeat domain-containing protein, partial [Myxococcales bacterium]